MRALNPSRIVAAIAILALAASTAMAASSSPDPSASASASASEAASASVEASSAPTASATPEPVKASEAPEASEAPDESEAPEAEDHDGPPTAAEAADIVARLKAAGITTTEAAFQALAAKVGTGGAVRVLAFAQASGKTPAQIVALKEGGMGWGKMRKELGISIGPGIGWIMGNGHGHGKNKDKSS